MLAKGYVVEGISWSKKCPSFERGFLWRFGYHNHLADPTIYISFECSNNEYFNDVIILDMLEKCHD